MRFFMAILMSLLCGETVAAPVSWNGVRIINDGIYSDGVGNYSLGGYVRGQDGNGAEIISDISGHYEDGRLHLKHYDFSQESMEPTYNWWAVALYGEIVNEDTFNALNPNHIEDYLGNDRYTGGTPVDNPDDFYMAFKVSEVLIENNDYVAGQTWYGWVHVSVDENLEMTLLGDGINLYGGAVVVGETPEPSSGLLLLVGGALLALRRITLCRRMP